MQESGLGTVEGNAGTGLKRKFTRHLHNSQLSKPGLPKCQTAVLIQLQFLKSEKQEDS
jgi:hypothetical protein